MADGIALYWKTVGSSSSGSATGVGVDVGFRTSLDGVSNWPQDAYGAGAAGTGGMTVGQETRKTTVFSLPHATPFIRFDINPRFGPSNEIISGTWTGFLYC